MRNFFSNLEACTTWTCVNSFAAWASALLTILISGSALAISIRAYQYAKRKDVEVLSISIGVCILGTRPAAQNAFSIKVTNSGHRSTTLKSYDWVAQMPFSQGTQLITYFLDNSFTKLSAPFPSTLADGDEAQFFQDLNVFSAHPTFLYHQSPWKAWLLVNSLTIGVTTTRRRHQQRLPESVRKLVWGFYKQDVLGRK